MLLEQATGLVGGWLFGFVARIIAAGFFCFSKNVSESVRFYRTLYPTKNKFYHLWCGFKQYQNFTTIHFDRFLASHGQETTFESQGLAKLTSVVQEKGAIVLMSHLGNWEIAATILQQQKMATKLLLYMGVKEKEGIEGMQKEDLKQAGITIVGVAKDGGSPFDVVTGIRCLQEGGIVSMTGDIVWREDQRSREVNFLSGKVFVPEAPYVFALVSGAPLFCFFSSRVGKNHYQFSLSEPIYLARSRREEREEQIQTAAQHYADLLEQQLRKHPLEWYHFTRFVQ